jgi:uncharacterized membrane protein YfcA
MIEPGSPWFWGLVALAALGTGLGKAGFGGFGMLAMLIMAEVFPARQSTGVILPMLITADILAVWRFRQFTVWRHVLRLLPPAAFGVVIGWLLMPRISDQRFAQWIGGIILVMVVLLLLMRAVPAMRNLTLEHPGFLWPTGLMAGITTMLANAAGPVATLYLLACRLPKMEFVGTGAWFFLAINIFKVPFSAGLGLITAESLWLNLQLVPLIAAGVWIGRWLLGKIPQLVFETLLLLFTVAGAIRLLLST